MKKLLEQIIKFGFVGAVAFLIEYGILILLTDVFGIYYLVSSVIAFTVSVIFNYYASVRWVFTVRKKQQTSQQLAVFIILSVIGLLINTLVMWLLTGIFGMDYRISKILATGVVMVYNFITRKMFLEERQHG